MTAHASSPGNENFGIELTSQSIAGVVISGIAVSSGGALTLLAPAALPFVEAGVHRLLSKAYEEVNYIIETCVQGKSLHELDSALAQNPDAVLLCGESAIACVRTQSETKIRAIRAALTGGVLYETGTKFDNESFIIRIINKLERYHIAILLAVGDDYLDAKELSRKCPEYKYIVPSIMAEVAGMGLVETLHENEIGSGLISMDGIKLGSVGKMVLAHLKSPSID